MMEFVEQSEKVTSLEEKAATFLSQYYRENQRSGLQVRLEEVFVAIEHTRTYWHTPDELSYGAKMAWRNSNRCIGRLFWKTLTVLDYRNIQSPKAFCEALEEHIRSASQQGSKIRSVISIFPPLSPKGETPFRILNYELIQYAGYRNRKGEITGDPKHLKFTELCQSLGWQSRGSSFDLLPLVFQYQGTTNYYQWPTHLIEEIAIRHPEYPFFEQLDLKWYKLPMVSNMKLEIGGIEYPTAPFNGWYMVNEIATRNFGDADRYNLLPLIAQQLKLDQRTPFWKDKALIVLNEAVLLSFKNAGATIVDHHTASSQFMRFVQAEEKAGRQVTGDWSWLVPPNAGSTTEVFHRQWSNKVKWPNFIPPTGCPMHKS